MNHTFRLLSCLTFALVACNADADSGTIESANFAPSLGVDLSAMNRLPSGMYLRDLVAGGGAVVAVGQTLGMHYTGWLVNGTQFDANTAGQSPLTFQLGASQVIAGWDLGIVGMRVGGRRQLVIPPSLGYGAGGSGPIPGNAILVFQVEVVSATP